MVSVLVPVYNAEKYLRQCLDSIVNQTYQDLQVVIINDGSTDSSWNICQQYAAQYTLIETYTQDNQGVAETRNRLLSHIKGDYVLFVDSDDWIEPNMVEFLLSTLEGNQVDMVTCSMIRGNDVIIDALNIEVWNKETLIYEFLRHVKFNGSFPNKLVKSSLLKGLSFRTDISYGEDALFMWQVIQNVNKVVITNNPLYHYRMNDDSISHQTWSPDKKGTGHLVWDKICTDVQYNWSKYISIAHARFALEDMWALYFAATSHYPYDEHIRVRQHNVRKHLSDIRKQRLGSLNQYIAACLIGYDYQVGHLVIKILNRFHHG